LMRRRGAVGCLLAVMVTMAPLPAAAQGPAIIPEAEALWSLGTWLVDAIASNAVGQAVGEVVRPLINTVLGRDNETKLKAVQIELRKQLDQGTANRHEIEQQLRVAKNQLRILRKLMVGVPDAKQLAQDRELLETDLSTIRSILAEHEKRLNQHDEHLANHDQQLADNDRRLTELERQQRGFQPAPASPYPAPNPVPPGYPQGGPQGGRRLMIEVRGRGNLIRLREATHPVVMGTFRLTRPDGQGDYFLPADALAIVELFAPASRISMPHRLAHQVQILSHGFPYQTQLY
jgi:hypothetical protein